MCAGQNDERGLDTVCQIRALEFPPPAGQDWVVAIWLRWARSWRSDGIPGAWGEMQKLAAKARACPILKVLPLPPACFGLGQPPTLAGMKKASTDCLHCARGCSLPLFCFITASWQRMGWGGQVAESADLTGYCGSATVLVFKSFPSAFGILRNR